MNYNDQIEILLRSLRSPQASLRRDSGLALAAAKSDVIPKLIESLGGTPGHMVEGDARSLSAAGLALVSHDPAIVGPRLVYYLKNGSPATRREAAAVLREMGREANQAAPALAEALHDSNALVRREAATALGCTGGRSRDETLSHLASLGRLLADDDVPEVRIEAAWSIGQLDRWQHSVEDLERADRDPDARVRLHVAAARGLVCGDDRPALAELARALADQDVKVRQEAAVALAGMGLHLSRAKNEIGRSLDAALSDRNSKVRRYAALALGHWGWDARDHVPGVCKLLEDQDGAVRWGAVTALCRIFTYPEWMEHPDLYSKWWMTLDELASQAFQAYPALLERLDDPEAAVRGNAAFAIGRVCHLNEKLASPAIAPLRKALYREVHPNVCLHLMFAIKGAVETAQGPQEELVSGLIAVARRHSEGTRIRKVALSVLAAVGPEGMDDIPPVLATFLDGDAESREDLRSFLRKAGPVAAETLLEEVWNREGELRRIRTLAAGSASEPLQVVGLERMGRDAIERIEELRLFWYVGQLWRSRQVNQMAYRELEESLWSEFRMQVSNNTIRKRLRRLVEFLTGYYVRHHARPGSSLAFLDLVQGRPPEMREDGWAAWEEVNRYFERMGATLK
jgi:HEAT repeat protein